MRIYSEKEPRSKKGITMDTKNKKDVAHSATGMNRSDKNGVTSLNHSNKSSNKSKDYTEQAGENVHIVKQPKAGHPQNSYTERTERAGVHVAGSESMQGNGTMPESHRRRAQDAKHVGEGVRSTKERKKESMDTKVGRGSESGSVHKKESESRMSGRGTISGKR